MLKGQSRKLHAARKRCLDLVRRACLLALSFMICLCFGFPAFFVGPSEARAAGFDFNITSNKIVDAKYFIAIYTDAENYPGSLQELESAIGNRYTNGIVVPGAFDSSGLPLFGTVKVEDLTGIAIADRVLVFPSDEEIARVCAEYAQRTGFDISYDPDAHTVIWYVVKHEWDGWHIDGVLIAKTIAPGSQEPAVPDEPADTEDPEDPADPDDPDDPVGPEDPEDPDVPDVPQGPDDPEEPGDPSDPELPDWPQGPTGPEQPDEPTDPQEPSVPDDPQTPADPLGPQEPSVPDEPSGPAEPEQPQEPSVPEAPETPAEPSIAPDSQKPSSSGQPDTASQTQVPGSSDGSQNTDDPGFGALIVPEAPSEEDPTILSLSLSAIDPNMPNAQTTPFDRPHTSAPAGEPELEPVASVVDPGLIFPSSSDKAPASIMSPVVATCMRGAGVVAFGAAAIGFGLANAGLLGSVRGLGSMDSLLRRRGRRF